MTISGADWAFARAAGPWGCVGGVDGIRFRGELSGGSSRGIGGPEICRTDAMFAAGGGAVVGGTSDGRRAPGLAETIVGSTRPAASARLPAMNPASLRR